METLSDDDEPAQTTIIKPSKVQTNTLTSPKEESKDDEVLDRLEEIKKAKPIVDEKRESIEKQISKPNQEENNRLYCQDFLTITR